MTTTSAPRLFIGCSFHRWLRSPDLRIPSRILVRMGAPAGIPVKRPRRNLLPARSGRLHGRAPAPIHCAQMLLRRVNGTVFDSGPSSLSSAILHWGGQLREQSCFPVLSMLWERNGCMFTASFGIFLYLD